MSLKIINQARILSTKEFKKWLIIQDSKKLINKQIINKQIIEEHNDLIFNLKEIKRDKIDNITYNYVMKFSFFSLVGINTYPLFGLFGVLVNLPEIYCDYTNIQNLNFAISKLEISKLENER